MNAIRMIFQHLFLLAAFVLSASLYAGEKICFGSATRETTGQLSILHLKGSWREMGRQYGVLMKQEIRKSLAFAEKKASAEADALLFAGGLPMGLDFLDQLFTGVAEGSGLSLDELVCLNSMEVAYAFAMAEEGKDIPGQCSALALFGAKTRDGRMLYGRNYDWLREFLPLNWVLACFEPADGGQAVAMLNYAGCLYLTTGMNSSGLFLELNDGSYSSADKCPEAFHNTWMLWQILLQARTTAQVKKFLQTLQGYSHYLIGAADEKRCLSMEWGVHSKFFWEPGEDEGVMAMTNHFVQPGWKNLPIAEAWGKDSSISRRKALVRLAGALPPGTGNLETLKQIFATSTENGGPTSNDTLCQVIAIPAEKTLLIHHRSGEEWVPFSFPE